MNPSELRGAEYKTKTPEYRSWLNMKQRCHNPNASSYKNYGARGIEVCEKWRNSFESFLEDVGPRPGRNWSLDRINNEGGYYPGNVRWATRQQQNTNQRVRKDNRVGVKGVHKNDNGRLSPWVASIVFAGKRIQIGTYRNQGEAIAARLGFERALDAVIASLPKPADGNKPRPKFDVGRTDYHLDVVQLLQQAKSNKGAE